MTVLPFHIALSMTLLVTTTITTKPAEGFIFRDFFGGNDSILFARLRCLLALQRTGFEIGDFASYPTSFRDDSIMELAQAGSYQGASDIEEYVKFGFVGTSPYYACCNDYIKQKLKFVGYKNGQCEFLSFYERNFELFPNTTAPPSEPFEWVTVTKIYFDFEERYIQRINLFFTDDFLRLTFDVFLNSANTRQYVCGVINGVCASTLNITANASDLTCEEQLLSLPSTEGKQYIDGKSQGCRSLHAVFAATNPVDHCAHLSYTPFEDSKGNIKCHNSKGTLPSSLFTESEIQMFKDFATSVGLDPELGHNYIGSTTQQ